MKKKKTTLDLMQEVRTTWSINPRTRVHDNDIRKNKKKVRREGRKAAEKALGEEPKGFFHIFLLKKIRRLAAITLILLSIVSSVGIFSGSAAAVQPLDNLISIDKLSSNLVVDLRYATVNNFTGRKLYTSSIGCLQEETAWKLIKANEEVMKKGYRIKIWDAYRPLSVQKAMWKIKPDARYVADPSKGGSRHNKGAAVDITLVDKEGREVEMPSAFDDFTYKASRQNSRMTGAARKNLKILTDAMVKSGFKYINSEWWHYDDTAQSRYSTLDVRPEDVSRRRLPVESLQCTGDSSQVILVSSSNARSSRASLGIYEKVSGKWVKMAADMNAFIGKNGFKKVKDVPLSKSDAAIYKHEGDGSSPIGAFTISTLFGWSENPGFSLPYRKTTDNDYWVSNDNKSEYNVWINKKGGPDKSWSVFEKLKISSYKYAAVIDYNIGLDRIVGNGSAIFLHIAGAKGYTSGCTAVSEADLLKVLKWMKPESKPLIVQGTLQELKTLKAPAK